MITDSKYTSLVKKLYRHMKILSFMRVTIKGVFGYCYVILNNYALLENSCTEADVRSLHKYVYNITRTSMEEFRNGISR